jgi:Tol biopolymer transport system component
MSGKRERILGAIGVCALLATAGPCAAGASAAVPDGPRLAMLRLSGQKSPVFELFTSDASGSTIQPLRAVGPNQLPAPHPFVQPSWSPDGSQLAFTGIVGQRRRKHGDETLTRLFLISSDGSGLVAIPGTAGGSNPVFSPDGHTVAFARKRDRYKQNRHGGEDLVYASVSTWLADTSTGAVRQITPWRDGLEQLPSSFSPDGSSLAVSRGDPNGKFEAVAIDVESGATTVLASGAYEPVYSPDGSKIALLRGYEKTYKTQGGSTSVFLSDLYEMNADGSGIQRLTSTPVAAEFGPSWDPSGQRLAYVRIDNLAAKPGVLGFGDSVMEINADGSCETEILSGHREALFGATWQPGPGRGAGRIACSS